MHFRHRIPALWLLPCLVAALGAGGCSMLSVTTRQSVDVSTQVMDTSTQGTRDTFNASTDSTHNSKKAPYRSSLAFVKSDMEPIRREAARGYGEDLTTLASLLQTGQPKDFARWMQRNYQPLFSDLSGPRQLLNRIYARRGMTPPSDQG